MVVPLERLRTAILREDEERNTEVNAVSWRRTSSPRHAGRQHVLRGTVITRVCAANVLACSGAMRGRDS